MVRSLRLAWYCEQTPALAWPGRRLKHLAESKDGCIWALGRELKAGAYGEPGISLNSWACLLHSSPAHTAARWGRLLLLRLTCYSPDRQGEKGTRVQSRFHTSFGRKRLAQPGSAVRAGLGPQVWSCCRSMAVTVAAVDGGGEGKSQGVDASCPAPHVASARVVQACPPPRPPRS